MGDISQRSMLRVREHNLVPVVPKLLFLSVLPAVLSKTCGAVQPVKYEEAIM